MSQFESLAKRVPAAATMRQQSSDVFEVYQHGRNISQQYREFVEGLAKGAQNRFKMAPPKKIYGM